LAAGISSSQIEEAAHVATQAGALGLKVSGAGGGGFMMVAVEPPNRYRVFRALERLGGWVFSFSFVEHGVESWKTESAARDGRIAVPSSIVVLNPGKPATPIGA
jgi:D-glycero-alpha-D-manno-heptose-7-phosphate kinase